MHEARLVLELPPGWEYRIAWTGAKPIEPTRISPTRTTRDLPSISFEPMQACDWIAGSARPNLILWSRRPGEECGIVGWIGQWYAGIVAARRNATAELSQKAHELTQGKPDFDSRVRALALFLQSDVRYMAVEIGIGGYQPHMASDIFRVRYGDCKDKATLLSTMLKERPMKRRWWCSRRRSR